MKLAQLLPILDEVGVEVLNRNVQGDRWIACLCPFAPYLHERGIDRNPSFFVKVNSKGVSACHCFTCKEHGRLSYVIRKLGILREENLMPLIIRADMDEIPTQFGEFEQEVEHPQRQEAVEETFLNMYPLAAEVKACREYLVSRGIHRTTCELLGLRFDEHERRILFPIRGRKGELYGYTGRAIEDTGFSRHRDYGFAKDQCLLGEHLFQKGKPVFLVEGLFAFAHAVEVGCRKFCNPMATLGSVVSLAQRDLLIDMNELVYLCFDDDAAGTYGIFGRDGKGGGAVDFLKEHLPVRVPLYPAGFDDPDDLDLQQFQNMVKRDYESH